MKHTERHAGTNDVNDSRTRSQQRWFIIRNTQAQFRGTRTLFCVISNSSAMGFERFAFEIDAPDHPKAGVDIPNCLDSKISVA